MNVDARRHRARMNASSVDPGRLYIWAGLDLDLLSVFLHPRPKDFSQFPVSVQLQNLTIYNK